ncbi:MAG: HAMP domain-containing histidine kinase [Yaniella sp.]|uniref:MtrAB system histidine kinase MtrB n=2 Tax=Yaniella sp. TaxID=2773929 RepID=UPI002648341E|nr:MtrAB system histidine kinase MtrB [Yaniella sp.]MDN5704148.1 HAMP domain-containing histidine kinase [Yaniella sp.]MDN5815493.1 HAMP domain-containing histidine kinase [Yaniella sp.]MDN5817557.1 HAMP domain-containing histidine kinase [Yaniella sp.]MDN5837795.1 HAMP domain-containing histidine kinase [Yaniella sp.]MDN5911371.1 HAMP domain-containing histidine kinase [Yaniella sp.]
MSTDVVIPTNLTPEQPKSSWVKRVFSVFKRTRRRFVREWDSSMSLRTAVIAAAATIIGSLFLAFFLTQQITNGLFQSRFNQVQAEANHALQQTRQVFENAATADEDSTTSLVADTLRQLTTDETAFARDFLLVPLDEDDDLYVGSMSSGGATEQLITDDLAQQVSSGSGIYYQSISLPDAGSTQPGLAFGTQVVLPPGGYYALYFIYDLSDVQATIDYLMNVLLVAGVGLLVMNIGIALWVTRSVGKPIQQAAQTAEWLSSGDLSVRMDVKRTDEIGSLSESFNKMADNIQDQITQLADLSQIQQRFVSDVSHELRTPLTTVRMASEVLYESRNELDPVLRRSTELMHHQVERFQALLADLLEISRFDAGAAEVSLEKTDLLHLVADVALTAQPLADETDTQLSIIAKGDSFTAEVDSRRIERILRNLVNNAIEHGESQPVDVILEGDDTSVSIVVRDHGMGMTEAHLEHVFDRFWRADPARTRTTGGSGLGLAIAVEDTRLHNGSIDAWGKSSQGSAFRVTLPRISGTVVSGSAPLQLPPEYDRAKRVAPRDVDVVDPEDTTSQSAVFNRITEQHLYQPRDEQL